jgi:hypothetical protein
MRACPVGDALLISGCLSKALGRVFAGGGDRLGVFWYALGEGLLAYASLLGAWDDGARSASTGSSWNWTGICVF